MMKSATCKNISVQSKYQKRVFLGQKLDIFLSKNVENGNNFLKNS